MKKGIICYSSKYGSAKKYAKWLQEALAYDCRDLKSTKATELQNYETVVLCGGIYASGIKGISFLKKHASQLTHQRIAVFCVGASPYDPQAFAQLKQNNGKDLRKDIRIFYGRGAWDESKMTLVDRKLCHILQKVIAKKDPDTYEPWMKALMEARGQSKDWCDKQYLQPLITYLEQTKL